MKNVSNKQSIINVFYGSILIAVILGTTYFIYIANKNKQRVSYTSPTLNSPTLKNTATSSPKQTPSFHVAFKIVNVYKNNSISSEVVTQAIYGEPVTILDRQNSWVKVSLPDQFDYQGWIQDIHVKGIFKQENRDYQIISVLSAKIRKQPREDAPVLEELPIGTVVESELSQVDSRFTLVRLLNGQKGYIDSTKILNYSKTNASKVSGSHIIETASQFLGKPYFWGGMSASGVDCSGFVHTVFKIHGLRLHRDADLQYFYDGTNINDKELLPGDLVFFQTYKPGPSHVGIYVGNRMFLQASSSQGVSYGSLDAPYFSQRFLGAKRII